MDILSQTRRYVPLIAGLLGEHTDEVWREIDWHNGLLFT